MFLKLIIILTLCLFPPIGTFAQRPNSPLIVDYAAPPPTYDQLWTQSPVIVRGQITASKVILEGRDKNLPFIEHNLRVLEVLKDDGSVGKSSDLNVRQPGGTTTTPDGREITGHTSGIALMRVGQEVIVHLEFLRGVAKFVPSHGPASVFVVEGDEVSIPESVRHYTEFRYRNRVPRGEVLSKLRAFKERGE